MLANLTVMAPAWAVVAIFAVFGAGFAMANAPLTTTAVSGMPTDRAGAASAVTSTSRQVGVSIGVALCGSLAGAALTASTAQYTADARPLWLLCAILGLGITALGIWSTSRHAIRSAQRLAPLIAGPSEPPKNGYAVEPVGGSGAASDIGAGARRERPVSLDPRAVTQTVVAARRESRPVSGR
jgi:MFS family permease